MMKLMGRDYANAPTSYKNSDIGGGIAEDSGVLYVTSRRWVDVYRRFETTSGGTVAQCNAGTSENSGIRRKTVTLPCLWPSHIPCRGEHDSCVFRAVSGTSSLCCSAA